MNPMAYRVGQEACPTQRWVLLFRTPMGSRLYGMFREDSDFDWLEVVDGSTPASDRPVHTLGGHHDMIRMSLSTFMRYAARGSHQALEAMFSPPTEVDLLRSFRQAYRCDTAQTVNLYRRTIKSFLWSTKRQGKAYRAALRMTYNLEEILSCARFNPVLPHALATELNSMPEADLRDSAWDRLTWLGCRFGV